MDNLVINTPITGGGTSAMTIHENQNADGATTFSTDSGVKLSVQQLVDYVSNAWAVNTDQQLNGMVKNIQQQNQELESANNILSDLRTNCPKDNNGNGTMDSTVIAWMNKNGIKPVSTGSMNQAQWNQEIQIVSGKINTMNSTSQITTIKMDQVNKSHSQIFEFMSNTNQLFAKTIDSVISGLSA